MTTIFETLKHLQRLPRIHRIAHLQSLIRSEKQRSMRRAELMAALRKEVLGQLRFESRNHRRLPIGGTVTPASENAA